jgi:hypothetical protein
MSIAPAPERAFVLYVSPAALCSRVISFMLFFKLIIFSLIAALHLREITHKYFKNWETAQVLIPPKEDYKEFSS